MKRIHHIRVLVLIIDLMDAFHLTNLLCPAWAYTCHLNEITGIISDNRSETKEEAARPAVVDECASESNCYRKTQQVAE